MQAALNGEAMVSGGESAPVVSPARRWFSLGLPWGASVAVHGLIVMAVLGISVDWPSAPGPEAGLKVTFDEPGERRIAPETAREAPAEQRAPTPMSAATAAFPELAMPTPDIAPLGGLETETLLTPVNIAALDAPSEDVATPAAAPEFFGARGEREATKVVYVVDASGSMVSAFASVARELRRSIDGLGSGQWFQVVLFNDGAIETPQGLWGVAEGSLIRATPENRRAVYRWLEEVRPERRSDPLPGLERALAFKPDLVFLLSKGILDGARGSEEVGRAREEILGRLERLNPRRGSADRRSTTIKVIQFFDSDPGNVLHAIAEQHGGTDGFSFISRKELGLE